MKLLKYLAAGILAVSFVGTASAQTKIYITGSTAFRAGTVNAISAILSGTVTTASDNAALTSANAVTWTGGNIGGTPVTIKASWSGSGAGIQTVAGNTAAGFTVRFLPDNASGTANADPRVSTNPAEVARPDVAMGDNLQASTLFNGTFLGKTYLSLVDTTVGVIPFRWVASSAFPAGKSMTPQTAQYLYSAGAIPLAFWTGLNADESAVVYASGRDTDSGTRVVSFAESGIGIFSTVLQYKPTVSAGSITALAPYPVQTINGVSTQVPGNSGENSGGSLRAFCNTTMSLAAARTVSPTATAGHIMTYLGVSDAASAISASPAAVPLLWNGVDFSVAAVQEGQYTFWGYEHLYYRDDLGNGTTGGPAVKLTFATNVVTQIQNTTPLALAPNVSINAMQVTRPQEGAQIGALYF